VLSSLEANKKIVQEFYDLLINKKDFKAASKYIGNRYVQHNPLVAEGPEGLKAFVDFLKSDYPDARSEIKRIFADGDYVIIHYSSWRTERLSSTGTRSRKFRIRQPIPTECSN